MFVIILLMVFIFGFSMYDNEYTTFTQSFNDLQTSIPRILCEFFPTSPYKPGPG